MKRYTITVPKIVHDEHGVKLRYVEQDILCDVLTIEASGAITTWKKIDDFRSVMLEAYAASEWKHVEYKGWEDDKA